VSAHEQDRALLAVRRVRAVRETDSRIGLQQALATRRQHEQAARAAELRLGTAPAFGGGAVTDLQAHVQHVDALARDRARTARQATSSEAIAQEATGRWQHDRTRLRAVELLLDRRAAERAAERDRREAHRLDDLAGQSWLRRTAAAKEADR
jgi:flagellar export protein FliJ